jgi:hypothetical protein
MTTTMGHFHTNVPRHQQGPTTTTTGHSKVPHHQQGKRRGTWWMKRWMTRDVVDNKVDGNDDNG